MKIEEALEVLEKLEGVPSSVFLFISDFVSDASEHEETIAELERDVRNAESAFSELAESYEEVQEQLLPAENLKESSLLEELSELWDDWRNKAPNWNLEDMVSDFKRKINWE